MNAQLFLSTSSGVPMYRQIVDQITAKVMAGDWPAGHPLPSIRELASASQISVITVKRAYAELGNAGVIVTRHGMGSFVAESAELPVALLRAEFNQQLEVLLACAARLGLSPGQIRQALDAAQSAAPDDLPRGNTP